MPGLRRDVPNCNHLSSDVPSFSAPKERVREVTHDVYVQKGRSKLSDRTRTNAEPVQRTRTYVRRRI